MPSVVGTGTEVERRAVAEVVRATEWLVDRILRELQRLQRELQRLEARYDREHANQVARLQERKDIYSFGPLELSPDFQAAIKRAVSGERIIESRP